MNSDEVIKFSDKKERQEREKNIYMIMVKYIYITRFLICFCMDDFFWKISYCSKCSQFGKFKKKYNFRKNKFLVYLILNMICLRGVWTHREYARLTPFINLVSLFPGNQGIVGETKDLGMPYQKMWPYYIS